MKKVLLVIFALISLNLFSQINVKEGSFRKIEGYVMLDKSEHLDDNDNPMALIKVTTENISAEERARFTYKGNIETYFDVQQHEDGQTYLYISAKPASFIEIIHPDYGKTEYTFPFDLCSYCGYEMVVQYVESKPELGFLAISSEPTDADIYIDGKHYGKTNNVITDLAVGTHELKLEKEGYSTVTRTFVTTKGETLKLNETLQTVVNKKTYLIVQADQADAIVYIDGEMLGAKEARKLVDDGTTHTYKIECKLYHEESGTVTVKDKTVVNKTLRPAFGYLNISSTPEQGANVWVDGDLLGVTPIKSDKLASGSHTVRVMKDMYKMKEQSFTVTDGQITNATLNMPANFVNVTINTDSQSDIYVDEEYKGKGRWTGRLSDGEHIFEARKTGHKQSRKSLDLVMGENKTITLDAPTPINGTIDIDSSPMGATIYIDGKHYGETPNYISDILIGEHELKLTKQGCAEIKKTIVIKEGETLEINEILQAEKEITITTDQIGEHELKLTKQGCAEIKKTIVIKEGETLTINEILQAEKEFTITTDQYSDNIYVDGNYIGVSPITTTLSYGSHEIKVERAGKTISTTINVTQSGGDDGEKLAFKQEIDGHEYVDLGLSVKWATCNVGANKPEEYGDYFAWGETSAKFSYKNNNSKTYYRSMGDIKGDSSYDAATANWGDIWRMPTKAEMQELRDRCNWEWITQNGVNGYKVTGPNGNSIFLPAAGYCFGSSVSRVQKRGEYWGSTPNGVDPSSAYQLYFNGVKRKVMSYGIRYDGQSVRPVIEPVVEIEPIVEPEPVVEKSLTIKKDKMFLGANLGIGNDYCAGVSVFLGADVAFPINKKLNLGGYAYFGNTGLGVGGLAVIDFKNESSIVGGLGFALSDYYSWPDVGFKCGYKFANGIYLTYTFSTEVLSFSFCYDFGRFL